MVLARVQDFMKVVQTLYLRKVEEKKSELFTQFHQNFEPIVENKECIQEAGAYSEKLDYEMWTERLIEDQISYFSEACQDIFLSVITQISAG